MAEPEVVDNVLAVFPEEVNLFKPAQMNVCEKGVRWKTWNPSFLVPHAPQRVVFNYPNVGTDYVDLGRTELYMKVRIVEKGTDVTFKNDFWNAETSKVSSAMPIDLIMQTMWQNVVIKLNGQIASSSNNTYAYKAYLEYLLSGSYQSKLHQGTMMGASQDSRYFDQTVPFKSPANEGLTLRSGWFQKVPQGPETVNNRDSLQAQETVEFVGKLFADICNQERYIINEVGIEINLIPSSDQFRLMVHGSKEASLFIEEIRLNVCHVSLEPTLKKQIDEIMDPSQPEPTIRARYPMGRVSVTPLPIPKHSYQMIKTDLWQGDVPSRVIVGFVDSAAYQGHYQKNPFYFNHYDISNIAFKLGNEDVPSEPLNLDISDADYLQGYNSLYQVANRTSMSEFDLGIDRDDYRQGHTLFAFSIDPSAQEGAGQRGMPRRDLTTLAVKFRSPLPTDVTCIVYATFHDEVTIDYARVVRVKSNRL